MSCNAKVELAVDEKQFLLEAAFLMRDRQQWEEANLVFQALIACSEQKHLPIIGLGTVAFAQGDFDRAIEFFESATMENSKSALAYAHLGEALAFGGHQEEGELALKKSTRLDPTGESGGNMAKTVLRFLETGLL